MKSPNMRDLINLVESQQLNEFSISGFKGKIDGLFGAKSKQIDDKQADTTLDNTGGAVDTSVSEVEISQIYNDKSAMQKASDAGKLMYQGAPIKYTVAGGFDTSTLSAYTKAVQASLNGFKGSFTADVPNVSLSNGGITEVMHFGVDSWAGKDKFVPVYNSAADSFGFFVLVQIDKDKFDDMYKTAFKKHNNVEFDAKNKDHEENYEFAYDFIHVLFSTGVYYYQAASTPLVLAKTVKNIESSNELREVVKSATDSFVVDSVTQINKVFKQ